MIHELSRRISDAESEHEYIQAVNELYNHLHLIGLSEYAENLKAIALPRKNIFSRREVYEEFLSKKESAVNYCQHILNNKSSKEDLIYIILQNFHLFCKNLYITKVHEKCSDSIKNHLTGINIQNEYDLQKFMFAVFSVVYPDVRTEVVQDSGHHHIRKDIIIDSEYASIELKCTNKKTTERKLSEEIASDIIHYDCHKLYFYIYDRLGIIKNTASFIRTYEERNVDNKRIRVIVYNHPDI